MNKILNIKEAIKIAQDLRKQNKTIVLAGGFFDILHVGHIKFLENAKKQADFLFILLEDDEKAKKTKGANRPINPQEKRAIILSALKTADYIIKLKKMTKDSMYDKIISQIAPAIIAATYPDPFIVHKKRQAKLIGGKVKYVIKRLLRYSTTRFEKLIK